MALYDFVYRVYRIQVAYKLLCIYKIESLCGPCISRRWFLRTCTGCSQRRHLFGTSEVRPIYFGCCRKTVSDGADVRCVGRLFQRLAAETGKARLLTATRLYDGTVSFKLLS